VSLRSLELHLSCKFQVWQLWILSIQFLLHASSSIYICLVWRICSGTVVAWPTSSTLPNARPPQILSPSNSAQHPQAWDILKTRRPAPFSYALRQCLNASSRSHSEKLAISRKGFSLGTQPHKFNFSGAFKLELESVEHLLFRRTN